MQTTLPADLLALFGLAPTRGTPGAGAGAAESGPFALLLQRVLALSDSVPGAPQAAGLSAMLAQPTPPEEDVDGDSAVGKPAGDVEAIALDSFVVPPPSPLLVPGPPAATDAGASPADADVSGIPVALPTPSPDVQPALPGGLVRSVPAPPVGHGQGPPASGGPLGTAGAPGHPAPLPFPDGLPTERGGGGIVGVVPRVSPETAGTATAALAHGPSHPGAPAAPLQPVPGIGPGGAVAAPAAQTHAAAPAVLGANVPPAELAPTAQATLPVVFVEASSTGVAAEASTPRPGAPARTGPGPGPVEPAATPQLGKPASSPTVAAPPQVGKPAPGPSVAPAPPPVSPPPQQANTPAFAPEPASTVVHIAPASSPVPAPTSPPADPLTQAFAAASAGGEGVLPEPVRETAVRGPTSGRSEPLPGPDAGLAPSRGMNDVRGSGPTAAPGFAGRGTPAPTPLAQAPEQIVRAARYLAREHGGVVHLRLEPQALGRLTVHVIQDHDVVLVELAAQSHQVREALQEHLPHLKQHLVDQGLPLGSLTVSSEAGGRGEAANRDGGAAANGAERRGPASETVDTPPPGVPVPAVGGGGRLDLIA